VPTGFEAGIPGSEARVWYAVLVPAGTPADVIAKLTPPANAWVTSPEAAKMYDNLGIEAAGEMPDELRAFIAAETAKWVPVVQAAEIEF
jgi:tripartite-type tricarboxylate transporter receptor subunit TctC